VDAGYVPLVADFFADADTQELAHACRKMPGELARGFQWRSLGPVLAALAKAAPAPVLGVVYGAGFEDRTHLLSRIAERWPLLGNDADTVETIKAPERFFALLDDLAIPHPVTVTARPRTATGWVAKRRGGAGGSHVVPARLQTRAANVYYQRLIEGRAVSALFIANGRSARVLGFSEQWTAPAPGKQWRYGGAVRPASLSDGAAEEMSRIVISAARALRLRGLASADFMLDQNHPYLIEINPRPGATLDIFAGAARPLLSLHVDAVRDGKLPWKTPVFERAAAMGYVHAPKTLIVPRSVIWPAWAADLPAPGERIDKQRPICTVLARAGTRGRAKRLIEERKASILATIQKSKGEQGEQEEQRRTHKPRHEETEYQYAGRAAGARPHR
jgi:predicted ATP-grasp superfamily ATP-dependent carboligase